MKGIITDAYIDEANKSYFEDVDIYLADRNDKIFHDFEINQKLVTSWEYTKVLRSVSCNNKLIIHLLMAEEATPPFRLQASNKGFSSDSKVNSEQKNNLKSNLSFAREIPKSNSKSQLLSGS